MNKLFIFLIIVFTGLFFDRLDIFKICLISSLLHECGHIAAYRILLKKWPRIEISAFGIKMRNNVSYSNFFVSIVFRGPFVNFLLVIYAFISLQQKAAFSLYILFLVNIIIFTINVLPVWFLDGGQILYCLSPFYQRNYRFLSVFVMFVLSVMLFHFTGVKMQITIFIVYFIINILNDI